jgi:CRISPR/Cas system CMR-associated protein Cmr5 small subunit
MNQNQLTVNSFQSRVVKLMMSFDRIFLFRKLFVMLAMLLLVTALAFAQSSVNRSSHNRLKSSKADAAGKSLNAVKERTILGETKQLGAGEVRSWVSLDSNGNPTAIGVTFSEAALSTLPKEPPPGQEGTEVSINFPQEAGIPFKHIGLDWNPNGHIPAHIYDVPHFDFHFYTITEKERDRITVQGDDVARSQKQLPTEFLPEGYIYVPDAVVPRMGNHMINPLSKELHNQAFTSTFLYGSYDGRLIFAEPMITKAFLEAKTNITEVIKQPAKYQQPGYYPTKYSVRYDPVKKEYTVALEGMTLR